MKLSTILAFRPADLLTPIRNPRAWPDGFWPHVLAHVVPGAICYGLAWYLGLAHPVAAAVVAQVWWQLSLEETYSTLHAFFPQIAPLPLWSILWDVASAAAGAGAVAGVLRILGPP